VLDAAVVYCTTTDTVTYDSARLAEEHEGIGDFAPAVLLAAGYSAAVQHALGRAVKGASTRRTSLCLTGAWAADVGGESGTGTSSLSPGDLDEAVAALAASRSGNVDRGTAFAECGVPRKDLINGAGPARRRRPARSRSPHPRPRT
jgi:predicted metalloprotease